MLMPSRKIVAIGGGENGRVTTGGAKKPYELYNIDSEIIRLTGKAAPHFLFLGHGQNEIKLEERYYSTMQAIYGDMFSCESKTIKRAELETQSSNIQNLIDWADIIYEGGGDTQSMIALWKRTGFDKILKNAWMQGKVICGISAGANCWFKSCSSAALKMQLNDPTAPMINVECLNFINAFFTPHCNIANKNINRLQHMKESLKNTDMVGIALSNCCAIEIIDNEYRLITDDASIYGIEAYGLKAYWENEQYFETRIDASDTFTSLDILLGRTL